MEKTKVVFRYVKYDDGDTEVLALFPEQVESNGLVGSYAHIGQHGMADYHHIIRISKPATVEQYAPLQAELERIGYDLAIRKKHQFYRR